MSDLPTYVPRDADAQLRTALRAAAARGGLVLLVGRSSVGKTRSAYEAIRDVMGDWSLWQPDDALSLTQVAGGPNSLRRTVIWLDEMHNYLEGASGLTAAATRRLLSADEPVVVVGTMWPDRYLPLVAGPVRDPSGRIIEDRFAREREVLGLANVIDIGDQLTRAERQRAELIAEVDTRVAMALRSTDYGMTQVLAAAPDLVRRWEHAPPYAKAVITAAVDARRLGLDAPLLPTYFSAASPGYLRPDQIAVAPTNWLDEALAYATEKVCGATAVLTPIGADMGRALGYTVAEYLLQYGQTVRRTTTVPEPAWLALGEVIAPADDLARLANAAESRGLLTYAERFYRAAVALDSPTARAGLASLLEARGREDEAIELWRAGVEAGDLHASRGLVDLLELLGRNDEAAQALRDGSLESSAVTRWRLAMLLERLHRFDEAEQKWRESIHSGDPDARWYLAVLLERLHRLDEAEQVLRESIAAGEPGAYRRLAILLERHGHSAELEQILRDAIEAGEPFARRRLAQLLERLGRSAEAGRLILKSEGQVCGSPSGADRRNGDFESPADVADALRKLAQRVGRSVSPGPEPPAIPAPGPPPVTGLSTEAIKFALQRTAEGTDPYAWRRLAFYLERFGRDEDARNLRAYGLAADNVGQEPWWSHHPDND